MVKIDFKPLVVGVFAFGVSACASDLVESKPLGAVGAASITGTDAGSITYYLPVVKLRFSAVRYTITTAHVAEAKRLLDIAAATAKALPADNAAQTGLAQATRLHAAMAGSVGTCQLESSLTALPAEGDVSNRIVANFKHSPWRTDMFNLSVNERGLLTGGSAQSKDETLEIAEVVASTVASIVTGVPSLPAGLESAETVVAPVCDQPRFTRIFDPTKPAEIANLNASLSVGYQFRVDVTPSPAAIAAIGTPPSKSGGLLYRRGATVHASVVNIGDPLQPVVNTWAGQLPQAGPVDVLPIRGGSFVTTLVEYDFVDGQPTRLKVDRPSEALEVVSAPLNIMRSIFEAPTELIQLKVNQTTQETALIEALKTQTETIQQIQNTVENSSGSEEQ